MERVVEFTPAYDKRHPDPKKNYGIHGVNIKFLLKGAEGAVQFLLFTNWFLPEVQAELDEKHIDHLPCHPQPADLGYHSLKPMYEGHKSITKRCPDIGGKPCYYDGSGLAAEHIFEVLVRHGEDAVWKELEEYYAEIFKVEAHSHSPKGAWGKGRAGDKS